MKISEIETNNPAHKHNQTAHVLQLLAYSAKAVGERPWHISMCMVVGSAALFALPIALGRVAWLAVALLTLSCIGIWGNHGPLLSWPAAILEGTAAAAGWWLF